MAQKKINISANLGQLVMYSMDSHAKVGMNELKDLAYRRNLDISLIPNPLSDKGAFQRATTWAAGSVVLNENPIICKEIENNSDYIVRTFERRVSDSDETVEKVTTGEKNIPIYEHVATMIYNRATGQVSHTILQPEGNEVVGKALARYKETAWCYNIQQLREMVQNFFRRYSSIPVRRNGGVNFIPNVYASDFKKFTKFCDELDVGIDITTFDIKNTADNRSNVADALNDHLAESLEDEIKKLHGKTTGNVKLTELIADFSTALRGGKLGKDGLATMAQRFQDTMKIVNEYRDLLQIDLDQTAAQIEVAKKQLLNLLDHNSLDDKDDKAEEKEAS